MIYFVIGLFAGGAVGMFVMALLMMSKTADLDAEIQMLKDANDSMAKSLNTCRMMLDTATKSKAVKK